MKYAIDFGGLQFCRTEMNFLQTAIAGGVVIPGVIVAGMYILPSQEERRAHADQEAKVAAMEKFRNEEESHLFVLQPFYISGGVFIVEMEARGQEGESTLCANLPLVHDAVVTALYGKTRELSTKRIQEKLKQYAKSIRAQVNGAFDHRLLKRVVLSYSDLQTFDSNYRRQKFGTAKRCLAAVGKG